MPKPDNNTLVIQPTKGWRNIDLKEIWLYRELLYFFAWRDIKVRYKQTVVGILWVILQPLITMIVFSIFFGKFAKIPSEGIPYPIFVYAGLLPWTMFAQGLTRSTESLVSDSNLIRKVYFPRLIIPIAATLSALIDFFVSFILLVIMMIFYGFIPSIAGFILSLGLVLLTFLCSIGIGFWLSAINVLYRDVRYVIPFVIQMGIFITPVIYPTSIVPEQYRGLLYLNPMTGIVESFRASLLGCALLPLAGLFASVVVTVIFLLTGVYFFRRTERKFADVI